MIKGLSKILTVTGIILLMPVSANADITTVNAISEFSTSNPPETFKISLHKQTNISNINLQEGTVLNCKFTEIKPPKRLKRDATFLFVPVSYVGLENEEVELDGTYQLRYIRTLEVKSAAKTVAKKAAKGIGGKIVPGLGVGMSLVEGAIGAEDGQRLKSAFSNVYESSWLSFVEKGKEVDINEGDILIVKSSKLKAKTSKSKKTEYKTQEDFDTIELPPFEN